MSKTVTVYLAGPISGCSYDEAIGWRTEATNMFEDAVEVLSPMRNKEALAGSGCLYGAYPELLTASSEAVVARDLLDVHRADCLLVYKFPGRPFSFGTPVEIGVAVALRKPIIMVVDPADALRQHPFRSLPGLVFVESLEDGVELIFSLFNL